NHGFQLSGCSAIAFVYNRPALATLPSEASAAPQAISASTESGLRSCALRASDAAPARSPRARAAYASSTRRDASHGAAREYKAAAAIAPAATVRIARRVSNRTRGNAGRPAAISNPSTKTAGAVTATK